MEVEISHLSLNIEEINDFLGAQAKQVASNSLILLGQEGQGKT